jgi:hypothetical protein
MSASKTRTDELLERWGVATARPIPAFRRSASRTRARSMTAALLLITLALLLAFVIGTVLLAGGAHGPGPTPAPSTSSGPPAGFSRFEAPGISFDYPDGWTDQIAAESVPAVPEDRAVGYLARGMTVCLPGLTTPPPPPAACEMAPTRPGTATLAIDEAPHRYPWWTLGAAGSAVTAGYPSVSGQRDTETDWSIESPDGGVYSFVLRYPKDEKAADIAVVARALESLKLTIWEQPPTVVNGLIHEDAGYGFTFDYPAGWVVYYPMDASTMDLGVVTVASAPLLPPPCSGNYCQGFSLPPGSIAIWFRIGGGLNPPDWSKAPITIGGQPAFGPSKSGPQKGTGPDEGYYWSVRLTDSSALTINASLRGSGLPALRSEMNDLIASIRITKQ